MPDRKGNKYVDPKKVFVVHENVQQAYLNYLGDAKKFQEDMKKRKDGHNDEYDEIMKAIAEERTDNAVVRGWRWKK